MDYRSRPRIVRQHEDTEVSELSGARCQAFLAVCPAGKTTVGPMYLRLEDSWHRFYLDAGLLFWAEGHEPDEDDDLLDDEIYVDWCELIGVRGVPIGRIVMHESILTLSFENGARAVLKHGPADEVTAIILLDGPNGGE